MVCISFRFDLHFYPDVPHYLFSSSLNNKDWENIPLQVRSYTRVGLDREELQRKVVKSVFELSSRIEDWNRGLEKIKTVLKHHIDIQSYGAI